MLIIINGPPGVGKTTISKVIAQKLLNSVYINGDEILNSIVQNTTTQDELDITLKNILSLIKNFGMSGYKNFVIDFVFEKKEDIQSFETTAYLLNIKCYSIYLLASYEFICRQNAKRKGEDVIEEKRIKELYKLFERKGCCFGKKIWVQGKEINSIVEEIEKEYIGKNEL